MPAMTANTKNFGTRFVMLRELGKGANGEVHLAFDNFLQRQVAIKIIRRKAADDAETKRQTRSLWLNETRLAKLMHPFIVQVTEAGGTDDFDYPIMEHLAGGTLKQFSVPGKLLSPDRMIDILYKVCNALDYANKMGVLRRDITPEGILLGENNAIKIADFGAAYCNGAEVTQVLFVGSLKRVGPKERRTDAQ
jgi:serine/threonine protein kinase